MPGVSSPDPEPMHFPGCLWLTFQNPALIRTGTVVAGMSCQGGSVSVAGVTLPALSTSQTQFVSCGCQLVFRGLIRTGAGIISRTQVSNNLLNNNWKTRPSVSLDLQNQVGAATGRGLWPKFESQGLTATAIKPPATRCLSLEVSNHGSNSLTPHNAIAKKPFIGL